MNAFFYGIRATAILSLVFGCSNVFAGGHNNLQDLDSAKQYRPDSDFESAPIECEDTRYYTHEIKDCAGSWGGPSLPIRTADSVTADWQTISGEHEISGSLTIEMNMFGGKSMMKSEAHDTAVTIRITHDLVDEVALRIYFSNSETPYLECTVNGSPILLHDCSESYNWCDSTFNGYVRSGLRVQLEDESGVFEATIPPKPDHIVYCSMDDEGDYEGYDEYWIHDADQDANGAITLAELLRVIQLFNAAAFHCASGTEDGFGTGPNESARYCPPHSSDYNPQDWRISLSELLRLIQFFNYGSYHPCDDGEDGFCPGVSSDNTAT